jgi:hypothetical protein
MSDHDAPHTPIDCDAVVVPQRPTLHHVGFDIETMAEDGRICFQWDEKHKDIMFAVGFGVCRAADPYKKRYDGPQDIVVEYMDSVVVKLFSDSAVDARATDCGPFASAREKWTEVLYDWMRLKRSACSFWLRNDENIAMLEELNASGTIPYSDDGSWRLAFARAIASKLVEIEQLFIRKDPADPTGLRYTDVMQMYTDNVAFDAAAIGHHLNLADCPALTHYSNGKFGLRILEVNSVFNGRAEADSNTCRGDGLNRAFKSLVLSHADKIAPHSHDPRYDALRIAASYVIAKLLSKEQIDAAKC